MKDTSPGKKILYWELNESRSAPEMRIKTKLAIIWGLCMIIGSLLFYNHVLSH